MFVNSQKFHYFRKGKSLCGKWMFLGDGEADDGIAEKGKKGLFGMLQKIERKEIVGFMNELRKKKRLIRNTFTSSHATVPRK